MKEEIIIDEWETDSAICQVVVKRSTGRPAYRWRKVGQEEWHSSTLSMQVADRILFLKEVAK